MQLRYRFRLTEQQRRALVRAFGNARVVYDDAVRARSDAYWRVEAFPTPVGAVSDEAGSSSGTTARGCRGTGRVENLHRSWREHVKRYHCGHVETGP